jgi:hypothetical protein
MAHIAPRPRSFGSSVSDDFPNFSYRNRLEIRQTSGTTGVLTVVVPSCWLQLARRWRRQKCRRLIFLHQRVLVRCCRRMMVQKLPRRCINYASTVQNGAAISDKGASDNPRSTLPKPANTKPLLSATALCSVMLTPFHITHMSSASVLLFLRPSLRCSITAAARAIKSRGPECNRSATGCRYSPRPRARQTSRKRQFWKRLSRSCRIWKTLHRPI